MDWLHEYWPMLVVLVGALMAYARNEATSRATRRELEGRIDALQVSLTKLDTSHEALKESHYDAQRQHAAALEAIRISITRIETILATMQDPRRAP